MIPFGDYLSNQCFEYVDMISCTERLSDHFALVFKLPLAIDLINFRSSCSFSYSLILRCPTIMSLSLQSTWRSVRKGKFGATMLVHTFDELVNIFLLTDVTLVFPLTQLSSRINIMVNHHVLIPTPWDQTSLYDVLMTF